MKELTAYKFLQLLIIGQINKVESFTRLSKYVKDEDQLHNHIEFDAISTAQLSRKQPPFVRDIGRLHVIDSTTMSMSLSFSQYPWATFRKTKAGVRIHTCESL